MSAYRITIGRLALFVARRDGQTACGYAVARASAWHVRYVLMGRVERCARPLTETMGF